MNKVKIVTTLCFVVFAVSIAILLNICLKMNGLFADNHSLEFFKIQYAQLQKAAGIYSITAFMSMLVVSFALFYFTSKRTFILLSNIIYIGVVLFIFVSMNKAYYTFQNIDYLQNSEYWLTVFMGIFYILGAILVSTIGYITIRNYTKRGQHPFNNRVSKN
jgi:hypothetical protein